MSKAKKILCALCFVPYAAFAKSGSVNYSWGADALATMHDFVVTMMLYVLYICYAVASVFVVVAALQIYIKMSYNKFLNKINEDLNIYAQNSA